MYRRSGSMKICMCNHHCCNTKSMLTSMQILLPWGYEILHNWSHLDFQSNSVYILYRLLVCIICVFYLQMPRNVVQLVRQWIIEARPKRQPVDELASDGISKHPTNTRESTQANSQIPHSKKPITTAVTQTTCLVDHGVTQQTKRNVGSTAAFPFATRVS